MATREQHISSFELHMERNYPQMSQQPSWPSNLLIWPNLKAQFWHAGLGEQVHCACSHCILCISTCARLASIEVVHLRKCAAMRVNEYVSQLSSPLQLSWTEAGGQLQVTAEKKGGVKIDLREKKRFFFYFLRQKGESALEVVTWILKKKAAHTHFDTQRLQQDNSRLTIM